LGVEETTERKLHQFGGIQNQNDRETGIDYTSDRERDTSIIQTVCTSPIAKEWEGYKTALKPAHEPIVMARKPFKGSTIDNVLKNGLGAMNIDATRVPWADAKDEAFVANTTWLQNQQYLGTELHNIGTSQKKKKSDRPAGSGKLNEDGTYTHKQNDLEFGSGSMPSVPYDPNSICGRYPSNVIGEVEQQKYFYQPTYDYRIKPGTDSIVINMIKEFLCKQNTSNS
jgi:hypothetical protein